MSRFGSPPRARGHGPSSSMRVWMRRFTPACAGTCTPRYYRDLDNSVHPRVRGDMKCLSAHTRDDLGSPPRARGHGRWGDFSIARRRFTPACAGT